MKINWNLFKSRPHLFVCLRRHKYEKMQQELQHLRYRVQDQESAREKAEAFIATQMVELSKKMASMEWMRDRRDGSRFRLCIDFSEHVIRDGLIHGNDRETIRYLGHAIGTRAAHEIRTINFARYQGEPRDMGFRF
jgi:hypothetical protein